MPIIDHVGDYGQITAHSTTAPLDVRFTVASVRTALDSAQRSIDAIRALLTAGSGAPQQGNGNSAEHDRRNADEAVGSIAIDAVPRWHFSMLNDLDRNNAFAVALERLLPPHAHVLDIGSGTGLLAMMAAKAGAASVTTCEQNPMLAEIARRIIAQHGLSDVITVAVKRSTDLVVGVDLPRPADLIVAEIVDCGLVGEGVLTTAEHARSRLLAAGGRLLPEGARLHGALLESSAIDKLNRVRFAGGFDVGLLNAVATRGHFPVRLPTWPHRFLSATKELCSFDFRSGPMEDGARTVELTATGTGTAHGLVAWFEMSLGAGVVLRNSPDNLASHWMQAFVPFAEPYAVTDGARVRLDFAWQRGRLSARAITPYARAKEPQ